MAAFAVPRELSRGMRVIANRKNAPPAEENYG